MFGHIYLLHDQANDLFWFLYVLFLMLKHAITNSFVILLKYNIFLVIILNLQILFSQQILVTNFHIRNICDCGET